MKAEVLQNYIKAENSKGRNFFDDLIIQERMYLGINQKLEYII